MTVVVIAIVQVLQLAQPRSRLTVELVIVQLLFVG